MLKASSGLLCLLSLASAAAAQTFVSAPGAAAPAAPAAAPAGDSVTFSIYERARNDNWQWFAAPPSNDTYSYLQSLLRISVAQRIHHWDWQAELAQSWVGGVPSDAVATVSAQGQLGLGGTYYAANGNNTEPAAAFFKQGFLRYNAGADKNIRLGRFEFFEGVETPSQRLHRPLAPEQPRPAAPRRQLRILANALRSFDGIDAHYGSGTGSDNWDLTAMAARADQGVFNMNGNPELNVDTQYLAFTHTAAHGRIVARAFAIGYHDGRTGITKTDNRPAAVRAADHKNIRLGTYGGDLIATQPAGPGTFDFVFWGALQNGNWGALTQSAGAAALEGGYRFTSVPTTPWFRGGWWRATGDNNPTDSKNNTFFQVLPTPRVYARLPFYNAMNSTDSFVQLIDKPYKLVPGTSAAISTGSTSPPATTSGTSAAALSTTRSSASPVAPPTATPRSPPSPTSAPTGKPPKTSPSTPTTATAGAKASPAPSTPRTKIFSSATSSSSTAGASRREQRSRSKTRLTTSASHPTRQLQFLLMLPAVRSPRNSLQPLFFDRSPIHDALPEGSRFDPPQSIAYLLQQIRIHLGLAELLAFLFIGHTLVSGFDSSRLCTSSLRSRNAHPPDEFLFFFHQHALVFVQVHDSPPSLSDARNAVRDEESFEGANTLHRIPFLPFTAVDWPSVLTPAEQNRLHVVLVNSRNPLNIGAAARALSNFGFPHLRVVHPYPVAFQEAKSAVNAEPVLAAAEQFEHLPKAIADCTLVVGTTGAQRNLLEPVSTLEAAAPIIQAHLRSGSKVAILFGSEKVGLSNHHLSHCHLLLRIPTQP